MFTETPVRNPVITEWDTNPVRRPSPTIPATTMNAPASVVRRTSAASRSSPSTPASAEPAARAAALVVVTIMRRESTVRPPAMRPIAVA